MFPSPILEVSLFWISTLLGKCGIVFSFWFKHQGCMENLRCKHFSFISTKCVYKCVIIDLPWDKVTRFDLWIALCAFVFKFGMHAMHFHCSVNTKTLQECIQGRKKLKFVHTHTCPFVDTNLNVFACNFFVHFISTV